MFKTNKSVQMVAAEFDEALENAKIKYQIGKTVLERLKIKRLAYLHVFPEHNAQVSATIYVPRRDMIQEIFEQFNVLPLGKTADSSPQFLPTRRQRQWQSEISPFVRIVGKATAYVDERIDFYAVIEVPAAARAEMTAETPSIAGLAEIEIHVSVQLSEFDDSLVVTQETVRWESPTVEETQYWAAGKEPKDVFGDYREK